MRRIGGLAAAVFAAAVVLSAKGEDARKLPPGVAVVNAADLKLGGAATDGNAEHVTVQAQPFTRAIRVRTIRRPEQPYGVQLRAKTTAAVKRGDVLLLSFWARAVESSIESGEATAQYVFERAAPPNDKSLHGTINVGRSWKKFDYPFAAASSFAAGEAQVCFQLGFAPQVIEIGGVEVTDFGRSVELRALPRTRSTYAGREPGAAWRKAAEDRIEKIRKGDLTVEVVDAAGRPIPGADVSVRMTRHAYAFGSAVAAQFLMAEGADADRYRDSIRRLFNRVVMENDLKWPQWARNKEQAIEAVKWLRDQGLEVRGHNLIWPGFTNYRMPAEVNALRYNPEGLRKAIADHILDETSAMRGLIAEWDVINEPFANHGVQDILGREVMIDWFKLARQGDPAATLFLNEYPILAPAGPRSSPHMDNFEQTLRFLIDGGAPLGGIGVQCHYGSTLPPPEQLLAGLDRLAAFKLPIEATEFDVDTTDEDLQADYLRDHLIAFFSHPSTNGVVMWGFWEGRHWKPAAALYRRDWSAKPAGKAFEDLVLNRWWTKASGTADAGGTYRTRGFLGQYDVSVSAAGRSKAVRATLPAQGAVVKLTLD